MTSQTDTFSTASPVWTWADAGSLLVAFIWGINFTMIKVSLEQIPPLAFMALRFTISTALIMVVLYLREGSIGFPRGSFARLFWLGLIGNTVYQLLFIIGLDWTTASNTALLLATMPVVVVLLGAFLRIERLEWRVAVGIVLAFTGITLVLAARGGMELSTETLLGDILVIGAVLCWSIYTLGIRKMHHEMSSLRITAWTMLTGTPGILAVGMGQWSQVNWGMVEMPAWAGLAYSALLALVVGYFLWNTSVQRIGSSRTAVYFSLTPLVAAVIAWIVLGEQIVPIQGIGAALIIFGILLTRRRAKR